jgi:transglutaminase-like putative cysteine protease
VTVVDGLVAGPFVDHTTVDWAAVSRVRFALHQRLRYDYRSPIANLRHRLMVLPRELHGDQRVISSRIDVTGPEVATHHDLDGFGNLRCDYRAGRVNEMIEFDISAIVERRRAIGPTRLPLASLSDSRLLGPTPLTWPDTSMRVTADRLARQGDGGLTLADRVNTWVHQVMRYRPSVTNVDTTASRALGLAQGVCQDYAHIMLALCRLAGLPCRYVSGHLLGEGGSHAWVEVVVPAPDGERDGHGAIAVPFDPTHGRRVGSSYLTVAVGRDYADVAPTYGTFEGTTPGVLSSVKRLGVSELDF